MACGNKVITNPDVFGKKKGEKVGSVIIEEIYPPSMAERFFWENNPDPSEE
jgi:hypothetical protein